MTAVDLMEAAPWPLKAVALALFLVACGVMAFVIHLGRMPTPAPAVRHRPPVRALQAADEPVWSAAEWPSEWPCSVCPNGVMVAVVESVDRMVARCTSCGAVATATLERPGAA